QRPSGPQLTALAARQRCRGSAAARRRARSATLQSGLAHGNMLPMPADPSDPRILIIDAQGQPVRWAHLMRAARYYAAGKVLTDLGENLFSMTGGLQEDSGLRSEFITSSIVMIRGRHRIPLGHAHVGLTKHRLFARDRHICAYCGDHFA